MFTKPFPDFRSILELSPFTHEKEEVERGGYCLNRTALKLEGLVIAHIVEDCENPGEYWCEPVALQPGWDNFMPENPDGSAVSFASFLECEYAIRCAICQNMEETLWRYFNVKAWPGEAALYGVSQ